ncbi:MAG: FixG Ig-like domain-containing protein [Candidatus Poseidoniales archaeon]
MPVVKHLEIAMSLNQTNWLAIALTFVLAGVFFVLISGGAEAVDYEHAVTISPDNQNGEPDDTLTFTVTIDNDGTEDDTYNLGMSSTTPTGWEMYILPAQISISDESSDTVTLYVEIGNRTNALAGSENFQIYCQSVGSTNNVSKGGVVFVDEVYGTSLTSGITQISVDPNSAATFSITVTNDKGNTEDTVTFTQVSTGTDDWSFTLPGSEILDVDESATVTFSITPDVQALAGLKSIVFYANSEDDQTAYSISLTVRVNQLPELEVSKVGSSAQDIEAGKRAYYSFEVTNKGNAVDSFDLSVASDSVPTGWEASLDNDEVSSLGVGQSINLTDVLVVKAPTDAAADVVATILVKVSSQENSSVYKNFTSRSTVLQNFDPKITIVGQDTQSANPDVEVTYNLKIENQGNGEDEISLALSGSNSTWGTLGESSFTLAAGANATTTLRVTAPEDTTAQNGYKITIKATSEDTTTIKNRDVFLNVNQVYEVSVSVSGDTTKSGDPGDTVSYSISVKNKGNSDDTITLNLEGDKASWGSIVEDVDLDQGQTKVVNLTVNIDEDAVVGDNTITVNGSSEDSITAYDTSSVTISVNKQYKVDVIVSSKSGDPGVELVYPMRVQNKGTGSDSFKLLIDDYPANWIVQLESEYVEDVAAGGEKTVNVTITIPSGEQNQAFTTNITASSLGAADENPPKWVNTTVGVTTIVNQEYWIDLSVESSTIDAIIGTPVTVTITIDNLGTGDDIVALASTAPDGWTGLEFNTSFLNVVEGSSGLVGLSITVPEGTNKGDYAVNVSGVSNCDTCANGTKSQDALTLTIKVELSRGVELNADVTSIEKIPGSSAVFSVDVKNTGDGSDTILMSILDDDLLWASVEPASVVLGKDETASVTITVALPEYDLTNISTQERDALEGNQYEVRIKAKSSGDLSVSDVSDLTTNIGQIYGASLTVVGSDTIETYPSTEDSANDRREKFTLKLINTGNRNDNVNVETVATSYPDEWTVSIFTSASCSSGSFSGSISAGESKYLYLCITPDADSDASNYTIITEASAGDGSEPAVQASTTLDVREPVRAVALSVADGEEEVTLSPEVGNEEKNTARFKITVQNVGSHDDKFTAELDNVLGAGWESDFFTKNSGNPGSSSDKWSTTGQALEKDQSKSLWFIAEVDADEVDEGNYTMSITVTNADEETQSTTTVTINIAAPKRDMSATAIDEFQEIYPDYGGTSTQNSVKFKVKLDNTGSNPDIFIPEIVSTLDDDWAVTFWQDSSKTQQWSTTSGLSIDDGELDDLWVFVEVADEADEGNYTIQISVRDEEDDPNAREDISLIVIVQRPELVITQSDITLEIDGVVGNASQVQDGDTVVILVDVPNMGSADADDVRIEIYFYPKQAPTDNDVATSEDWIGFEFDEGEGTWIYSLYDKTTNIKSQNQKSIASDDWLIKGGEWYVEVRIDYDEDDDSGKILEPNENNNDARYSELLRVKPDLVIDSMRIDSKYAGNPASSVPNVDDIVTFTVTVSNTGAADVDGARLYITADDSEDNKVLKDRTNKDYVDFDVDAGETTDVRFRWKAVEEEWATFRAEINPVCDDYSIFECETAGDGLSSETGHMFDELGRYADNEYPRSGVFEQSGSEVKFEILPDFIIKKVSMDPRNPEVGEDVEIKITIENQGNADWEVGTDILLVVFEDGTGEEYDGQIMESIPKGDTAEVKISWTVPNEDNKDVLDLTYTINAGSGNLEIRQCDTCDAEGVGGTDNDELQGSLPLVLPAVLGEIEFISDLTERELIKGVPLLWPVLIGIGLVLAMVAVPILRRRARSADSGSKSKDTDESSDDSEGEEAPAAAPSKIGVVIVSSVDGKTANVKVPSNMPVNKLLQNCIEKFQLPHSNFAVMLNGAPVDVNASLTDAGLTDSCQIDLVPLE